MFLTQLSIQLQLVFPSSERYQNQRGGGDDHNNVGVEVDVYADDGKP